MFYTPRDCLLVLILWGLFFTRFSGFIEFISNASKFFLVWRISEVAIYFSKQGAVNHTREVYRLLWGFFFLCQYISCILSMNFVALYRFFPALLCLSGSVLVKMSIPAEINSSLTYKLFIVTEEIFKQVLKPIGNFQTWVLAIHLGLYLNANIR